jgi:hypothetical protein
MKVRLLKAVFEADRFGNQTLKVTQRASRGQLIAWTPGVELEMSDASGQKYVERGIAVKVEEPAK